MRRLLFFFAVMSVFAETTTVTVTQTVVGPDGQPAGGQALIRISAACKSGAVYVGDRTIQVKFNAAPNNFSVALVPNSGGCQGTSYTVSWLLNGGRNWTETWVVPTSSTPLLVDAVVVPSAPKDPPWLIQWQQLAQNGAEQGQSPIWDGARWIPGFTAGSGGVWGAITGTLANQTDLQSALDSKEPAITSGTMGQYFRGDKTWQPLNTGAVPESGNLYFTSERASAAAPVQYVFGRSGAVTAQSGDYTFPQIGGTAGYSQLPVLSYSFDFSAQTYNAGTVNVTNGSAAVTGIDTAWTPDMTGKLFISRTSGCDVAYLFTYVSATSGTLSAPYECATVSGVEYQLSDVISIPGTTHQLGTADLIVQCFDGSTPRVMLDDFAYAAGPSVDPANYGVQIVFWRTQAGRCVLHR